VPRRKRSLGKATWPGRKQVWRRQGVGGEFVGDLVALEGEHHEGETLLRPVMRGGRRIGPASPLSQIRDYAADQLEHLPPPLRRLEPFVYPVEIGRSLRDLASDLDRKERTASDPRP